MSIRVLFMGRKAVAAACLELLHTSPSFSVVGVLCDSHLAVSPTRDMANKLRIPLLNHKDVDSMIDSAQLQFDLGLSVLYWRKIKGSLLKYPRLGIINFHPAPLPDLKGYGGYNIAILERRDHYGVTAHYVDAEIDTGAIIKVTDFAIDKDVETAKTLEAKSMESIDLLFREVIDSVVESPTNLLDTTVNSGGRYTTRKDIEEMKQILPSEDVDTKIRAFWFPPYHGAKIQVEGKWYTLVNDEILLSLADPASSSLHTPGV